VGVAFGVSSAGAVTAASSAKTSSGRDVGGVLGGQDPEWIAKTKDAVMWIVDFDAKVLAITTVQRGLMNSGPKRMCFQRLVGDRGCGTSSVALPDDQVDVGISREVAREDRDLGRFAVSAPGLSHRGSPVDKQIEFCRRP
jgi:hypothetical protein